MSRNVVYKIDEGVNPRDVYCTTYQMRNFYLQFGAGFYSTLDVMNYIQHQAAVNRMRSGDLILDVCCGRGLLLPMIRWYKRKIAGYVGVDISERNIREQLRRSASRDISGLGLGYYPFPIRHVVCSCEDMCKNLNELFDGIVYTSSIEHMQKEVGFRSLENCFSLMRCGGWLFLSCPNTFDKVDPYDTQYPAHVYEWNLGELRSALSSVGFRIMEEHGLVAKVRSFEKFVSSLSDIEQRLYWRFKEYLPSKWLMALFPTAYPEAASEVLLICEKP